MVIHILFSIYKMHTIKAPLTMLKGENNFWKSADTALIPKEM